MKLQGAWVRPLGYCVFWVAGMKVLEGMLLPSSWLRYACPDTFQTFPLNVDPFDLSQGRGGGIVVCISCFSLLFFSFFVLVC